MTKKLFNRINYVQSALKEDVQNQPDRSLKDFNELVTLIGDQFEDDNTYTIKPEIICLNQI